MEKIIRCIILLVGLVIAHFGVTLYLLVDLGADPFNVLVQGIFRTISSLESLRWVTHGNVHIIICLLIITILLVIERSYVKIGTVLCMVFGGPIIDFFTMIMSRFFQGNRPLWLNIVVEVLACVILAVGMSIVIKSDAGTGPNDLVAIVISDKTKLKFSMVRVCTDISFVIIGAFLGGIWGIGTFICAGLVGPVAGFFLPYSEGLVHRIINKYRMLSKSNGCK